MRHTRSCWLGVDLMICGGRFIRGMCLGGGRCWDLGRIEDFCREEKFFEKYSGFLNFLLVGLFR